MPGLVTRLIRQCGRGGENSCNIVRKAMRVGKLKLELKASSHTVFNANIKEKDDNPNKMPFEGVLLLVDTASTKPPHGSQGHRIYVPKEVAAQKLEGLLGQAINYDPGGLEAHATRHKVGVVTRAWIDGNKVKVKGFIWKKDFPEAVDDLKKPGLGMSMELADVYVRDENEDVWHLEDFEFTGATILKKDAAAYYNTSLAAQAAVAAAASGEGEHMPKTKEKQKNAAAKTDTGQKRSSGDLSLLASAIGAQLQSALTTALTPVMAEFKSTTQRLSDELTEMRGTHLIEAAADQGANDADADDDEIVLTAAGEDDSSDDDDAMAAGSDDESSDDDDMAAASDDDDDDDMAAARGDDDDDSSSDDDDDDLEAMEDLEQQPAEMKPGEMNKNAKNKGNKTSVTNPPKQGTKFKGNVAEGRLPMKAAGGKGMKKPFPGLKSSSIQAAAEQVYQLSGELQRTKKVLRQLQASAQASDRQHRVQIKTMRAQLQRFADQESRRSVMPVELTSLANKVGVNLGELKAAGSKLSVGQADQMFAAAKNAGIILNPQQRIAMKMLMEQEGLLETGVVDRGYGRN